MFNTRVLPRALREEEHISLDHMQTAGRRSSINYYLPNTPPGENRLRKRVPVAKHGRKRPQPDIESIGHRISDHLSAVSIPDLTKEQRERLFSEYIQRCDRKPATVPRLLLHDKNLLESIAQTCVHYIVKWSGLCEKGLAKNFGHKTKTGVQLQMRSCLESFIILVERLHEEKMDAVVNFICKEIRHLFKDDKMKYRIKLNLNILCAAVQKRLPLSCIKTIIFETGLMDMMYGENMVRVWQRCLYVCNYSAAAQRVEDHQEGKSTDKDLWKKLMKEHFVPKFVFEKMDQRYFIENIGYEFGLEMDEMNRILAAFWKQNCQEIDKLKRKSRKKRR